MDEQGWLHTGDLARVDEQGCIFIVDRKKEMLVSGGFNVYPREVETVIAQHPAVYEVCVVGVPDERWGEAVKAVVVLRQGAQAGADELMQFCDGRLAGFTALGMVVRFAPLVMIIGGIERVALKRMGIRT